jgi:hypothetical protein
MINARLDLEKAMFYFATEDGHALVFIITSADLSRAIVSSIVAYASASISVITADSCP